MRNMPPWNSTHPATRAGARDHLVSGSERNDGGGAEVGARQSGCEVMDWSRDGGWVKFGNRKRWGWDRFVVRGAGHVVFGFHLRRC